MFTLDLVETSPLSHAVCLHCVLDANGMVTQVGLLFWKVLFSTLFVLSVQELPWTYRATSLALGDGLPVGTQHEVS